MIRIIVSPKKKNKGFQSLYSLIQAVESLSEQTGTEFEVRVFGNNGVVNVFSLNNKVAFKETSKIGQLDALTAKVNNQLTSVTAQPEATEQEETTETPDDLSFLDDPTLTKRGILEFAKSKNIEVDSRFRKQDLIDRIKEALS